MAAKTYRCKVELTTRLQSDGNRLTFYPGDIIEAKFLRKQTDRLLEMGTIEEVKKTKIKTLHAYDTSDADNRNVDGP